MRDEAYLVADTLEQSRAEAEAETLRALEQLRRKPCKREPEPPKEALTRLVFHLPQRRKTFLDGVKMRGGGEAAGREGHGSGHAPVQRQVECVVVVVGCVGG